MGFHRAGHFTTGGKGCLPNLWCWCAPT